MRTAVAILLAFGCGVASAAAQTGGGDAGKPRIGACSLLPKELALKVTTQSRQILDMIPPQEEPVGAAGSACHYGGITLQVDPFTAARLEDLRKQIGKDWVATPGIGQAAYFRDNRGEYAELYVHAGSHVFTIQMDVPDGKTAAAVKPNVLTLANEIVARLK